MLESITQSAMGMSCMSGAERQNPCQHEKEPHKYASWLSWDSNQKLSCSEETNSANHRATVPFSGILFNVKYNPPQVYQYFLT